VVGDYRTELFDSYDARTRQLDPEPRAHRQWFAEYARRNYLPHLWHVSRSDARFLEIGCSTGQLLSVLHESGFQHLEGIDLSPGDIETAQRVHPELSFECADAQPYLLTRPSTYEVVLMKAVLEHVPKSDVLPLLRAVHLALKPSGIVLVDVPNMDWLFAGHERYMDFTHEVGFTQESLSQVMGAVFRETETHPIDNDLSHGIRRLRTRMGRLVAGTVLSWADPEGGHGPIWCRSLMAVGRR
jgi:2-polyprenyl-3-methyl-5-hydroxy-6-metoxy-1,4-benzoquinol methylase